MINRTRPRFFPVCLVVCLVGERSKPGRSGSILAAVWMEDERVGLAPGGNIPPRCGLAPSSEKWRTERTQLGSVPRAHLRSSSPFRSPFLHAFGSSLAAGMDVTAGTGGACAGMGGAARAVLAHKRSRELRLPRPARPRAGPATRARDLRQRRLGPARPRAAPAAAAPFARCGRGPARPSPEPRGRPRVRCRRREGRDAPTGGGQRPVWSL